MTVERPKSKRKSATRSTQEEETSMSEPETKHVIRKETHIFQKKLTEAERREHAGKLAECEWEIDRWKNEADSTKKFVLSELSANDPIRIRAKEIESKRRSALHVVEKKRAELMREFHLHAAADGYVWIDVECEVWADDIEQEVYSIRTDTFEQIWRRRMNEDEQKARKKRLQLSLDDAATH